MASAAGPVSPIMTKVGPPSARDKGKSKKQAPKPTEPAQSKAPKRNHPRVPVNYKPSMGLNKTDDAQFASPQDDTTSGSETSDSELSGKNIRYPKLGDAVEMDIADEGGIPSDIRDRIGQLTVTEAFRALFDDQGNKEAVAELEACNKIIAQINEKDGRKGEEYQIPIFSFIQQFQIGKMWYQQASELEEESKRKNNKEMARAALEKKQELAKHISMLDAQMDRCGIPVRECLPQQALEIYEQSKLQESPVGSTNEQDTASKLSPDAIQRWEDASVFVQTLFNDPSDKNARAMLKDINRSLSDQEQIPIEVIKSVTKRAGRQNDPRAVKDCVAPLRQILEDLGASEKVIQEWMPESVDTSNGENASEKQSQSGPVAGDEPDITSDLSKFTISVKIDNEIAGTTRLGQVEYAFHWGYGSRVVVNRGTDKVPYHELYVGSHFGSKAREEWKERTFKATPGSSLKKWSEENVASIDDMVKRGKHTYFLVSKGESQMVGNKRQCVATGEKVLSTKSQLLGLMGKGRVQDIADEIEQRRGKLAKLLDEHKSQNLHPETSEPLTEDDKHSMPWLCSG